MQQKLFFLPVFLIFSGIVHGVYAQSTPLADSLFALKDWEHALPLYSAAAARDTGNALITYRLGLCYHKTGKYDMAVLQYQKAIATGFYPVAPYRLAAAYARLNKPDSLCFWLNEAVAEGFQQANQLQTDPDFDAFRQIPCFRQISEVLNKNAHPCSVDPHHRDFDFWIGEWNVYNVSGQKAGESSVQLILDECVIFENWTDSYGNSGKSFNLFDAISGKWRQTWVDDKGFMTEYLDGVYSERKMVFVTRNTDRGNGATLMRRMTFFNLGPDQVRQFGEKSTDGGKEWTTEFDLIYQRK